jgi:caa(3)-type oxidase subunit IV
MPVEGAPTARYAVVWLAMLAIAALEVATTYQRPSMPVLVGTLVLLAAIQASLGLLYFMGLRRERALLGWTLVGTLLFVLLLLNQLWPDALRVLRLGLHA